MIYEEQPGHFYPIIIDFGRVSDLTNGLTDEYIDVAEKTTINDKRKEEYEECRRLHFDEPPPQIWFIIKILKFLKESDFTRNQRIFPRIFTDISKYQMNWIEKYVQFDPPRVESGQVIFDIYNLLFKMMFEKNITGIHPDTIIAFDQSGELFNFGDDIYIPPPTLPETP